MTLNYSGSVFEWNSEALFSKFIGKMIALSDSDQYLFVYVKDLGDYMCSYLIDVDSIQSPFLYLSDY